MTQLEKLLTLLLEEEHKMSCFIGQAEKSTNAYMQMYLLGRAHHHTQQVRMLARDALAVHKGEPT